MEKRNLIYLALIVLLGICLRFLFLTSNPPSLNWDEVSHGYNAYSILKTGMDQWGQKFPILNFRAYGDYPTALNLYLTIPFIYLFGLTEFAVRAPHAVLGVLTIISVYFISWGVTKNKYISLLSSFLVAVDPWNVFTSRFALQSNLSVFLLTGSMALFFNREKSKHFLPTSLLLLFLTLFSYHNTRIFSPLFLAGLIYIFKNELKSNFIKILIGLFFLTAGFILINPSSRARGNVLFLVDQGAVNRIESSRNNSKLPSIFKKAIYNRPAYFASKFAKNYLQYLAPNFLFLNGGTQYQFSIPNRGVLYIVGLPFFYIGLAFLVMRSLIDKNYRILLLWLILAPIPASLTNESYAVIRATTMLPIPEILISLGLYGVMEKIGKKYMNIGFTLFIVITLLALGKYMMNYSYEYRTSYSWSWQYGYKEIVKYSKENYDNYDKIIITKKYGEPHEYFLFFWSYDPAKYQNDQSAIRFYQSNWYWVDRFDKFYFINDWQVKEMRLESGGSIDCNKIKCLLITSPDNYPTGWSKLETVNSLDGKPTFEMYKN